MNNKKLNNKYILNWIILLMVIKIKTKYKIKYEDYELIVIYLMVVLIIYDDRTIINENNKKNIRTFWLYILFEFVLQLIYMIIW